MSNFFTKIIVGIGLAISSLFGSHVSQVTAPQNVGAAPQYVAAKPTFLYGGGISSSDTSIKLTSLVTPAGTPITTAQLVASASNVIYITVEPNTTKKETVSCNAVTQNGDGTATLTGCTRGLQFTYPYTALASLALSHSGGSAVVLSNSPQVYNDIITYIASTTYAGTVDASPTAKGILEVATANEAAAHKGVGTGDTTAYLGLTASIASSTRTANTAQVVISSSTDGYIDSTYISSTTMANFQFAKFGGTGADGALTLTSGVTNIDCALAQVCVKNYTSISITGTASLTFSNPSASGTLVLLKSQGNVTLTSSAAPMLSVVGMGGAGGALTVAGHDGLTPLIKSGGGGSINGGGGSLVGGSAGNGGGAIGATSTYSLSQNFNWSQVYNKYPFTLIGGGGGGGSNNGGTGGIGGNGGGALVIECAGAWNFTTTNGISIAGAPGATAATTGYPGGGGGAGSFLGLYNTLTANSGTVTTTGGATGTGGLGGSGVGGGGFSLVTKNTEF